MIRPGIALGSWLLSATLASAQTAPAAPVSVPEGGMSTKSLTVPGAGGVADTGLGGTGSKPTGNGAGSGSGTSTGGAPGTGMSVKGAAGQGIGGQGASAGNGVPAKDPTGSGTTPRSAPAL